MAITDLTGTTWIWNDNLSQDQTAPDNLNFVSNGKSFIIFIVYGSAPQYTMIYGGQQPGGTTVLDPNDGWIDEAYKTITFTGGEYAQNQWFINYMYANATLVNTTPVEVSYNNTLIHTAAEPQTFKLDTAGKYCESDIEIKYNLARGSALTPATTITANPSISVSSGGLITATASASQSVTPTVTEGYVEEGTAGTITVSGSATQQLTTQAAQTIHPSTSDQSIASETYLLGTQTIKGVLLTNLTAGNIKKDVVVKVGDSTDDDCVTSVTGTYEGDGNTYTLVVTVESGAAVTATDGTTTVTGTSVNGTCTLSLPNAGTWTVSATNGGQSSSTETVSVVDTYAVALSFVSTTLNDNSWNVIREVSDAGTGANYWSVGDRKWVTLNGTVGNCTFSNTLTYAFIIGFNHNSGYEGGNRIHFQFAKTELSGGVVKDVCFIDSKYNKAVSATGYFSMNSSSTNVGGWSSSQMRNTICGTSLSSYSGTFIAALPSSLRSALKTVTKYTDNTGNSSTAAGNVTETTDVIFLPSEWEVFGARTYANTNEQQKQAQYAYYSAGNSKVKYRHTDTASTASWLLRSPASASSTRFSYVNAAGGAGYADAYYSAGFAPCFCV